MAADAGIDEVALGRLVSAFYARVREDEELGPIFNDAIHDWPEHVTTLTAFWSSVMLTSGRYKGNPMMAHLKHKDHITPRAVRPLAGALGAHHGRDVGASCRRRAPGQGAANRRKPEARFILPARQTQSSQQCRELT